MPSITKDKLAAILAKAREDKIAAKQSSKPKYNNPAMDSYFKEQQEKAANEPVNATSNTPTNSSSPNPTDLATRLAALRASRPELRVYDDKIQVTGLKGDTKPRGIPVATKEEIVTVVEPDAIQHLDRYGNLITYNSKQQKFVKLAASGKSCILIGAAGTGKTTCMQGALESLIQSGRIPKLDTDGHKYLTDSTPGCVIIAYTRRATNNIRRVLSEDLKHNAITSHKLLEYAPEVFEIIDESTGEPRKTMRFIESRNAENPLPNTIATIVVEEASMLSVELYAKIEKALQHEIQWIFLGDLNQLPPVFGSAILGFKLLELPVVELTEVYRQALESPIIRLAHRIISGKVIPPKEFSEWKYENQLTIHPWKKKISADDAVRTLAEFFKKAYDNNIYNIDEDIILIPYNKACGSIELNKHIANHIARKHQLTTYEVIAGFNKHYFSVGDKVLYDKEDAEIIDIAVNNGYAGAKFQAASKNLDYWGHNPKAVEEYYANANSSKSIEDMDVDFLLDTMSDTSDEDRVRKASHIITLRLIDSDRDLEIDTAAAVNNLLHAYALTVHKAQGSEWRKVYICLHQSHATMLQRELLYTAVTRAREELYVICEPETFVKGIEKQRIKGNTLAEKAEFFKGKLDENTRLATGG
jgi:exodeoxyribonuclease V alpha subunit